MDVMFDSLILLLSLLCVILFIIDLFRKSISVQKKISNFALLLGIFLLFHPFFIRVYGEVWFWLTTPGF